MLIFTKWDKHFQRNLSSIKIVEEDSGMKKEKEES